MWGRGLHLLAARGGWWLSTADWGRLQGGSVRFDGGCKQLVSQGPGMSAAGTQPDWHAAKTESPMRANEGRPHKAGLLTGRNGTCQRNRSGRSTRNRRQSAITPSRLLPVSPNQSPHRTLPSYAPCTERLPSAEETLNCLGLPVTCSGSPRIIVNDQHSEGCTLR